MTTPPGTTPPGATTPPGTTAPGTAPRFDRPCFTTPCSSTVVEVGEHQPLPRLDDPPTSSVTHPIGEPLVRVAHRRIRVLSNYWHAGWTHARPECWLREGAMGRLATAAEALPDRFGLAVFDAWRPLDLQAELYDAAYADPLLPPGFVAEPNPDPTLPPPHLTGGTVDLTLTYDGTPLALGTGFDDFTDDAFTRAFEERPSRERELRRLLYATMRGAGFVVLHCEWWHFEHGTRRWAAIVGAPPKYGAIHG